MTGLLSVLSLLSLQTVRKGKEKEKEEEEEEEDDREATGKSQGRKIATLAGGASCSLDVVTSERNLLREHNARLHQVLQDVLQTTAAAEETMGLHLESLRLASFAEPPPAAGDPGSAERPPTTTTTTTTTTGDLRSRASLQKLSTKPFHLCTTGKSVQGFFVEERSYSFERFPL
ncbi:hypothetical protein N1851_027409 [Merluccius polli]|uniref:Uncharacterized protein n=1 Tax=Merluccius polli TaxID=89951 RepID=A0AA47MAA3_MERPO|nr:hypothetical protein N1851_027409 [Merluccius polli]